MDLLDIVIAKQLSGGGGGSGTDNYNDLSNLPKINDTTLSGNKSSSALGLQSEINSDSKLASDLVDDTNQTNKFATSTEKQTWNAKQNAIDADHKLSSSLVSFSTAEAAALASGIDSSKVGQISTNQTNILYVSGKSGKNIFNSWDTFTTPTGLTITKNADGSFAVSGTSTTAVNVIIGTITLDATKTYVLSGCPAGGDSTTYSLLFGTTGYTKRDTGTGITLTSAPANTQLTVYISIGANYAVNKTFYPMICTAEDWTIGHDYVPYALPNYDLTRLESEDRAGLIECVDGGAKNLLQYQNASWNSNLQRLKDINPNDSSRSWSGNVCTFNGVSYTVNSDGTISTSGTASSSESSYFTLIDFGSGLATSAYAGNVLSGCPTEGNYSTKYSLYVVKADGNTLSADEGNSVVIGNDAIRWVRIIARNSTNMNGKVFKPMICTKAAFGVSNKFVPYRPNYDLVCNEVTALMNNMGGLTFTGSDLNTLVTGGRYLVNNASDNPVSNAPYNSWQTVEVFQSDYSTYPKVYYQIATDVTGATVTSKWRRRTYSSGGQYNAWTSWSS